MGTIAAALLVLGAPVELRWTAPPQCPSQAEVRARVDHYLGAEASSDPVVVDAEVIDVGEEGWRLTLTTTDEDGSLTRTVVDTDCDGLAETTAVLTALAVSPNGPESEPVPPREPVPLPEPSVVLVPPPESEPEPVPSEVAAEPEPPVDRGSSPRPRTPLRWGVRAAAGVGLGWLPVGADVGLAVSLGARRWAVEVEGMLGTPRDARLDRLPTVGADLLGWSVAGRGCGVLSVARWLDAPLCAGIEGGLVQASPVGLEDSTDAARPWVAVLVSPSLYSCPPFALLSWVWVRNGGCL